MILPLLTRFRPVFLHSIKAVLFSIYLHGRLLFESSREGNTCTIIQIKVLFHVMVHGDITHTKSSHITGTITFRHVSITVADLQSLLYLVSDELPGNHHTLWYALNVRDDEVDIIQTVQFFLRLLTRWRTWCLRRPAITCTDRKVGLSIYSHFSRQIHAYKMYIHLPCFPSFLLTYFSSTCVWLYTSSMLSTPRCYLRRLFP